MEEIKEGKNNQRRVMSLIVLCVSIIALTVSLSYAYFISQTGMNKEEKLVVKSGTLSLTFRDNTANLNPKLNGTWTFGDSIEKELIIENTGTLDAYAKINWDDLVNTYLPQSLTYTLEYRPNDSETWTSVRTSRKNVPRSEEANTLILADRLLIPAKKTYIYRLTIKLENLPNINQTQDLNATFSTKFTLEEGSSLPLSEMIARPDWNSTELIWGHCADIKKIVFESKIEPKENAKYKYDLSKNHNGTVMSYLVPTKEENTKYTLYIQGNGEIIADGNSSHFFRSFTNLESIENLIILDTRNVTNMYGMFMYCDTLTTLNLSNFDTSNVTDMGNMFYDCRSLTTLNLSNFDTSKVTNMSAMFVGCSNLATLDVSNFDTSKVTTMNSMFSGCSGLTALDVSNFDTSNVTDMSFMFSDCSNLATLDLSKFDTSKVTKMSSMFQSCSNLATLDLSNFDTSKVTKMGSIAMLSGVSSTIQITVNNNEMKQWVIDDSTNPKLTDSNIIVQA